MITDHQHHRPFFLGHLKLHIPHNGLINRYCYCQNHLEQNSDGHFAHGVYISVVMPTISIYGHH